MVFNLLHLGFVASLMIFASNFGSHGGMATMSILDNDSNLGWGVFLLCWYLVLYKYLHINESNF